MYVEVGDRRKFGDQGTNLRNFWEKSNIRLRLISELMEKSKSQPSSKSPPQYWTPNHEVQKPTFNTNFAKFYKENYKSYSRKMYFMYIFLKTSIKVWLWNISDKTLLLKFGFMNTAMWSPKPNSEPNFWPKRTTEFNRGQNSGAAHLYYYIAIWESGLVWWHILDLLSLSGQWSVHQNGAKISIIDHQ